MYSESIDLPLKQLIITSELLYLVEDSKCFEVYVADRLASH